MDEVQRVEYRRHIEELSREDEGTFRREFDTVIRAHNNRVTGSSAKLDILRKVSAQSRDRQREERDRAYKQGWGVEILGG